MTRHENKMYAMAVARSKSYGLLATWFAQPTENTVALPHSFPEASFFREAMPIFSFSILEELENRFQEFEGKTAQEVLMTLIAEHNRLFSGVGHSPVPPYEAVYVDGGLVMGESTLLVQKQYEEEGLQIARGFADLPDHVSAELEFMSVLCDREARAWQSEKISTAAKYLRKEKSFLQTHLLRWVSVFCTRLASETRLEYYNCLAKATNGFVTIDNDQISALLENLTLSAGPKTP